MSTKCRVMQSGKCEITQGFSAGHLGGDITNEGYTLGTIVAHSAGKVILAQDGYGNNQDPSTLNNNSSYGNMVKIDHGNGFCTLYAHMQKGIYVKNGQQVSKGQALGYMGNSGYSFGGHLHFEVWKNGSRINPFPYLDSDFVEEVKIPTPVDEDKERIQLKVNCADTMRVRKGHTLNSEVIGFAKIGFYNILNIVEQDNYNWCEVEKDKWIAIYLPYCEIYDYTKEEIIEEPIKEQEPSTEEQVEEKKESWVVKIFKFILQILKNLFGKSIDK